MGCHTTAEMSREWPCHDAISRFVWRTSHTLQHEGGIVMT